MASKSNTDTYTSDFRLEVETAENQLLRRRFLWFTGVVGVLGLLMLAGSLVMVFATDALQGLLVQSSKGAVKVESNLDEMSPRDLLVQYGAGLASIGVYLTCFVTAWRGRLSWDALRQLSYWIVFLDGLIHLVVKAAGFTSFGLFGAMVTHIIAASFLPWTPMQSLRPMVPLLVINAGVVLTGEGTLAGNLWTLAFALFVPGPGAIICWLKTSVRFAKHKTRFLQRRYAEVRRELTDARRIHQSLFPAPVEEGPIRFGYRYEPMRQIGGDFLYIHPSGGCAEPHRAFSVVILDVTGHGIPAALTVNRLHGELERVYAENPRIRPPEVLRLLNRYTHLTLSTHAVFVTAMCLRIEPEDDRLEYASGGHPPAFLRAVDGTLDRLCDTAPQLGVFPDAEFDHDPPRVVPFRKGDTVIAYTDGAIEAADRHGRMFGVTGIERLIARAGGGPTDWTAEVMGAVEAFRYGPARDDTLVIELTRPLGR